MKPRPFQRLRLTAQLPRPFSCPVVKCVCSHLCVCPQRPEGGVRSPGTRVTKGRCELPHVGSRDQTEVLCRSSDRHQPATPSPHCSLRLHLVVTHGALWCGCSRWPACSGDPVSVFKASRTGVHHVQLALWDLGIGIPIRTGADKLLATEPSSWLSHALYESLRQVPVWGDSNSVPLRPGEAARG